MSLYEVLEIYYTIPSDNRELQQKVVTGQVLLDYTIPSDNRELQQNNGKRINSTDYTIPSDNRELQPNLRISNLF